MTTKQFSLLFLMLTILLIVSAGLLYFREKPWNEMRRTAGGLDYAYHIHFIDDSGTVIHNNDTLVKIDTVGQPGIKEMREKFCISGDGRTKAYYQKGSVHIVRQDGTLGILGPSKPPSLLALSENGEQLLALSNLEIKLIDTSSHKNAFQVTLPKCEVHDLDFSSSHVLVVTRDVGALLYRVHDGHMTVLKNDGSSLIDCELSNEFAILSLSSGEKSEVSAWKLTEQEVAWQLSLNHACWFSLEKDLLFIGAKDGECRVVNVRTGEIIAETLIDTQIMNLIPNSKYGEVIIATYYNGLRFWNYERDKSPYFALYDYSDAPIALTKDGNTFATLSRSRDLVVYNRGSGFESIWCSREFLIFAAVLMVWLGVMGRTYFRYRRQATSNP
jgi:WD40 repeat protein